MTEPKIIDEAAQQNQHATGWVGPSAKRHINDDEAIKGPEGGSLRLVEDTHNRDRFGDIERREAEENIPENPMKKKPMIDFK